MRPANRDALMLRLQSPDCRFGSGLPGASLQALVDSLECALIHTAADGLKDTTVDEHARIYFLAGLQHFSATFPPQIIAAYNVEHCREAGGTGLNLDLKYLFSLGPQVLPILEPRLQQIPALQPYVAGFRFDYETRTQQINWRAWGFRTWRLDRYLSNNPGTPSNFSKSSRSTSTSGRARASSVRGKKSSPGSPSQRRR